MNLLTKEKLLPLRKVNVEQIIIHCSATPPDMDIGFEWIDQLHRKKGWLMCGYHKIIRRDGMVEPGRPLSRSGAHCRGYNHKSWGVCLIGGVDSDLNPENNFTELQISKLREVITNLIGSVHHDLKVIGHNEVSNKACPSFDVQQWLKDQDFQFLNLEEQNINDRGE